VVKLGSNDRKFEGLVGAYSLKRMKKNIQIYNSWAEIDFETEKYCKISEDDLVETY
jgi:hypothetical protein